MEILSLFRKSYFNQKNLAKNVFFFKVCMPFHKYCDRIEF